MTSHLACVKTTSEELLYNCTKAEKAISFYLQKKTIDLLLGVYNRHSFHILVYR